MSERITVYVCHFPDRAALQLQWTDPESGRRRTRSARTADPDQAELVRADLEYELNHGLSREPSRMTWEVFRKAFEAEYLTGVRANTARNYRTTLSQFERLAAPVLLGKITERTISQFVSELRKQPGRGSGGKTTAPGTIKVRLQFLHTVLSWAVKQKLMAAVPRFPTVKVPKKDPQPVPLESFERMLARAEGDLQMTAYLLCGWLAGLRLSEAADLCWEQTEEAPWLDLVQRRIVLPAGFVKAARDQWVPLDQALEAALLALPRREGDNRVFRFLTPSGRAIVASGVSQRVIALARRAGVRITMKSLRRGFGCRHAGRVSAHVLQRLMRHANIATTMTFYANIDQAVEEAILGRNTQRNTPAKTVEARGDVLDASPSRIEASSP